MKRKYFPFCFYVLVSVLCLGKPSLAYPAGHLGGGEVTPAVTNVSERDSITPLKIGDKIPDELWEMKFPVVSADYDDVQHLKLGDYRDKLIILDFWATWCAPCISSLHKLDTLQKEFADDLLVFPTSYEAKDRVRKFFVDKGWGLPTAFDETYLKKYFPHRSIPHQVWLKDGEVMAIAGPEYASRGNILTIIKGDRVKMLAKEEDVDFDPENIIEGDKSNIIFQSAFTKRANVRSGGVRPRQDGLVIYNTDIHGMIREAYSPFMFPAYFDNRVIWEVSDSIRYKLKFPKELNRNGDYKIDSLRKQWLDAYTYCYVLSIPYDLPYERIYDVYRRGLDEFLAVNFNCELVFEEREVPSLVLRPAEMPPQPKKPDAELGDVETEVLKSHKVLYRYLNRLFKDDPRPVIQATGLSSEGEIIIPSETADIGTLNIYLARYGVEIVQHKTAIKMLIVKELN